MAKLTQILQSEYCTEYRQQNFKMDYSIPKIYPKIILDKPLSSFSEKEKKQILEKYPRWYVYYSFRNPETGLLKKQASITFSVNRDYPLFDDRFVKIRKLRSILEKVLKEGKYSPYENHSIKINHTVRNAFQFVLSLKKLELKKSSYRDYETRTNLFLKFLQKKGLDKIDIKDLTKSNVNEYLNYVLRKSSPSNRNNTRQVISAIFSKLVNDDFIDANFVKDGISNLKSTPKKNTAFSPEQVKSIFEYLKEKDIWLYYFCAHVYYALFRNIEVVRIKVKDVDIKNKTIKSKTKTGDYYKQIPQILIDEFYSKLDLDSLDPNFSIFTKNDKPSMWLNTKGEDTEHINRRGYFGKRFAKVVKDNLNLSKDYTIYSFRHSAIGKYFLSILHEYKDKGVVDFENKALEATRAITIHKSNEIVRTYLREIGYYKINDWSSYL